MPPLIKLDIFNFVRNIVGVNQKAIAANNYIAHTVS